MSGLVFYSDQEAPATDRVDHHLLRLIGKPNPTIGYIPFRSEPNRTFFHYRQEYYGRHGIALPVYFELDVNYQPELLDQLLSCDAIHLSGGDTFYFLYWLRKRKLVSRLRKYVRDGGTLIGVSAGSILMTPQITSTILCGDVPPEGWQDDSGLNLVDFMFMPHVHRFTVEALEDFSLKHGVTLYGCHDEDGVVVEGGDITLVGDVIKIVNGKLAS